MKADNENFSLLDPIEVEANHNGRVTESQRQRYKIPITDLRTVLLFIIVMMFLLVLCIINPIAFELIKFLNNFVTPPAWIAVVISLIFIIMLISLVGFWAQFRIKKRKIEEVFSDIDIEWSNGELQYNGHEYEALTSDRRLRLPEHRGGLVPGVFYRFYYLVDGNDVLSAERIGVRSDDDARLSLKKTLMQVIGFGQEDLDHNQSGDLAAGQWLQLPRNLFRVFLFSFGLFILGTLTIFAYQVVFPTAEQQTFWSVLFGPMIPGFIVGVILFGIWLYYWFAILVDVWNGKVKTEEGRGRRVLNENISNKGGNKLTYYYQIGDERFRVSKQAYNAMIDGIKYRLYFTPLTRVMVSIEPIDSPLRVEKERHQPEP
ncbi:MAG: hypothetical protein JEZ06_01975 [Anaerolineaceae bacterium]|nr:hypothetical protein [Anaerolineaceae bacterium]